MSADLYSDLTIGLGIKNYPKMTPHMPQSDHWFQHNGKVSQKSLVGSAGYLQGSAGYLVGDIAIIASSSRSRSDFEKDLEVEIFRDLEIWTWT